MRRFSTLCGEDTKGSLSCASSALKIKLPSGFQLKSQSVLVNGIQANVSDQTDQEVTVLFNLPAGPHSEEIEVSFQAKALCELVGSSIADPTIAYTLSGCNLGEIKGTSEAINIRFAVLRVSVTPDPILSNIGDQMERSIKIRNQGNGSISSIHLERTLGDGLSHISYDFSSLTALGWTIDQTNPNHIIISGSELKSGKSITLQETVSIDSCALTPTEYEVYYACSEKCSASGVSGSTRHNISLVTENAPHLSVKASDSSPIVTCFNNYGKNTWTVTNHGSVATEQIKFVVETQGGINASTILVNQSPAVVVASTANTATITLPALTPGASHTIVFDQFYPSPQGGVNDCAAAPTVFSNGQNSFTAIYSFEKACAPVTFGGVVKEETMYYFSGSHIGEVDIVGGSPYMADYLFTQFNIPANDLNVGDEFVITVELSEGLSTDDFSFDGIQAVAVGDRKYELTFVYGTSPWENNKSLDHTFERLQLPLVLECPSNYLDNLWYRVGGELRKKDASTSCQSIVFRCNQTTLNGMCPVGPCEDGLDNGPSVLKRTSIGHQVNNAGVPTLTAVSTEADTRSFYTGDLLEISQTSIARVTHETFHKVKFVVDKDPDFDALLKATSGKVSINGNLVVANASITETAASYILEYTLDQPVQNADVIKLAITIKAKDSETGLKRFATKSYLISDIGTPYICGRNYTATGFYVTNLFNFIGATEGFITCEQNSNHAVFSADILGFRKQDVIFKKEFRKLFVPTTAELTVPTHLTMTGVKVAVKNQPWLGNDAVTTTVTTGLPVTGEVYSLNVSEALKTITAQVLGQGDGIDYLDEGFELVITPIVSLSSCEPNSSDYFQQINVTLSGSSIDGEGLPVNFSMGQNITYETGLGTLSLQTSNNDLLGKLSPDARQVSWVVKVESSQQRKFNSVWFAKKDGALEITSVKQVDSFIGTNPQNEITPNSNGIYTLGNFESGTSKYYLIDAEVINCSVEELVLTMGYNCASDTYPSQISEGCALPDLRLTHKEIENIIQTSITGEFNGVSSKPNLCEEIGYTVVLHNAGDSQLNELKVKIPLHTAPGLNYNNKFEYSNVYDSDGGQASSWTLGAASDATIVDDVLIVSLPIDKALNTVERIEVKVFFKVDSCDFTSGVKHTVTPYAKNSCGTEVTVFSQATTKRILIEGGSNSFPEVRTSAEPTIDLDPVLTTGGVLRAVYNAEIINSGEFGVQDAITSEYQIALKLPENWTIVGDPASYLLPQSKVKYIGLDETRGYVYQVLSDIHVGETLKFDHVPLKYSGSEITALNCEYYFGKIRLSVFQNINVADCNPNPNCSNNGIDQLLYENLLDVNLPVDQLLTIDPAEQIAYICHPSTAGGAPTLADVTIDGTAVFHLDWYENLEEATTDLPENRLPISTPLVDGRTYYVINKFIADGICKSNIGAIKVEFKDNHLTGSVNTICAEDGQTYKVQVVLTGEEPFGVVGTGTPGTFSGNVWTSEDLPATIAFGQIGTPYDITFTDANSCSPLHVVGEAPMCCSLEIICPVDILVTCGHDLSPSNTGVPQIIKSCGLTTYTYEDSVVSDCENKVRKFNRTFFVKDEKGNIAECTQEISIQDTTAPVLSKPARNKKVQCSVNGFQQELDAWLLNNGGALASDACSDVTWTNDYHTSHFVSSCGTTGSVEVTFTATDACGNKISTKATFTVEDTIKPTFTSALPSDITVSCVSEIPVSEENTLTASDNCTDVQDIIITVKDTESNVSPNCSNNKIITRVYTATDACGNFTTHTQTITVSDKIKPVFDGELPKNATYTCDADVPEATILTATDNCGEATVTMTESRVDGSCENSYVLTRIYTATDSCGNATSHTQTITVSDTVKPVFVTVPQNKVVECDGAGNLEGPEGFHAWLASFGGAEAVDNCGDVTMSYLIEDTNTICGGAGTIIVDFIAKDSCGNFTIKQATYAIFDTTPPVVSAAQDLEIECSVNGEDELNAWLSNHGGATAQDSCGLITWSHDYKGTLKICGEPILVTFTATDSCGNKATTTALVKVVDTQAPVLTKEAQNLTVSCGANTTEAFNNWLNNRAGAKAMDTCSVVTWSNDYDPSHFVTACGTTGSIEVVFTAKDACDNIVTTSAVFTIEDTTAPTLVTPAQNKTVSCDGNGNISQLEEWLNSQGGATAKDTCSNSLEWTNDYANGENFVAACGSTGSVLVTFTATDDCGNQVKTTATFTITDTVKPVFVTAPQNKVVECDGSGNTEELAEWLSTNGYGEASDVCGDVTYSYEMVDTIVGCGKTSKTTVLFTATDACGNFVSKQATFEIKDTQAPEIVVPASELVIECGTDQQNAINAWLSTHGGASAQDACSTNITWSNNYTGLTKSCGGAGEATVTFTATDSCGNKATTTALVKVVDTQAPVLTKEAQNLTVSCGANTTEAFNNWLNNRAGAKAMDTCSVVTWSNDYDPSHFVTACGTTGSVEVVFTAKDACDNIVTTSAVFTIEDTTAPTLVTPAQNKTVSCDGNGNISQLEEWLNSQGGATAKDTCSNSLEWTNDYANGENFVAACGSTGSVLVTFTATDDCGNQVKTTATFTITDTVKPVFVTAPQNKVVECDGSGNTEELAEWLSTNGYGEASDVCGDVTYSYEMVDTIVGCGKTSKTTVLFTATDACGNFASKQATFEIKDTQAPEFIKEAESVTVECDGNGNSNDLTAWLNSRAGALAQDACSTNLTWSNNFKGLTKSCGQTGTTEVTFTVVDACGNSNETKATFTIVDTVAPVFTGNLPKDKTIECSDILPEPAVLSADDLCSKATVSLDEQRVEGSCPNNYELIRTWTATDACGNSTQHQQVITVQDTQAPQFVGELPKAEIFIKCEDLKDAEVLTAIDNCGPAYVTTNDEVIPGACDTKYSIIRTWTASDVCGNETTFTQTIHLSCQIEVFNAVTPNGDGMNDELVLNGIECYPGNRVEIFNRWGVLVYETRNYNSNGNTFKGYSNGRVVVNKDPKLPSGTYYYVITYDYDLGDGNVYPIQQAGYLHLENSK